MWFRRRSPYAFPKQKGHPPKPPLLETSVGSFEVEYSIALPNHLLGVIVYEQRDGVRQDDGFWGDEVASVSDLAKLLVRAGIPEDEAEIAARGRFGDAVRHVQELWPDFELRVDPDE